MIEGGLETAAPWEKRNARHVEGFLSFDRFPPSCCKNKSWRELYRTRRAGASTADCNDDRHAWPDRTGPRTWSDHADAQRSSQILRARRALRTARKFACRAIH